MVEALVIKQRVNLSKEWLSDLSEVCMLLSIPENSSAYPHGIKELCESKVNLLCGVSSTIVSG